jgi:uncharacterized membrane protein
MNTFSVGGAISFGWKRTWKNFWWLLLVGIIFTAINAGIALITAGGDMATMDFSSEASLQEQLQNTGGLAFDLVGSIVQGLVTIFLALGVIRIALAVTSGDRVRIGRLWSFDGFGRYFFGGIIVSIIVTIAIAIPLLIGIAISAATDQVAWAIILGVVGVIIAIIVNLGFSLFGYVIIDKNAKGLSSLGDSWRLVKPHFGGFLGLHILIALIIIATLIVAVLLGILLIFVGLLVTLPVAGVLAFGIPAFALAYAYRTLAGEPVA